MIRVLLVVLTLLVLAGCGPSEPTSPTFEGTPKRMPGGVGLSGGQSGTGSTSGPG